MPSFRTKAAIFIGIAICFFALRLINLGGLPIFTDEATYIHWVKLLKGGTENLWITFESENKKPLVAWLTYSFYGLFKDPLTSCRFASVIFGFAAFLSAFMLALKLFNWRVASLAALIYAFCPFMVFHERMFFMDHLVTLFATLFLIFLVRLAQNDRLRDYVWSGLFLGLATTSKEIAMMYLIVPLVAFRMVGRHKLNVKIFITLLLAFAIPFGASMIPHLKFGSKLSHMSAVGYLIPLQSLLSNPFPFWLRNLKLVAGWYLFYLGPLFVVIVFGIVHSIRLRARPPVFLLFCGAFVPLLLMLCAQRWYSRYILFSMPPLLVFSAWTITEAVENREFRYALLTIVASYFLIFDALAIHSPASMLLPPDDREQYVTGWPSGYGLDKVISFFEAEAKQKKIDVFLPNIAAHPTDALFMYLGGNQNIALHVAWWLEERSILGNGCVEAQSNPHSRRYKEIVCFDRIAHAYFVANLPQFKIEPILRFNPNMELVLMAKKPEDKSAFVVFKLR